MYNYKATIVNVVDGDTFDAIVQLGFYVSTRLRFRLCAVDTAEIFRPVNEAEKEHGLAAKKRMEELVLNKEVTIQSIKIGAYNRWEAVVTLPDGSNLSSVLLAEGFQKKESY